MRIRLKLTVLLLVFALAPLVTVEVIDTIAFGRLARRVDEQLSANVARRVEQELAVHVRRSAAQMAGLRRRVMMMTRTQGVLVGGAMSGRSPAGPGGPGVFDVAEFDALAPGEVPARFTEQPGWPAGRPRPVVSYEAPVLWVPEGAEAPDPAVAAALAGVAPAMNALSVELRESVRAQFVSLATGAHLSYPAKGGYSGFDPRERVWYQAAVAADGEPAWVGPYLDAITQEPRLTCAVAVFRPDAPRAEGPVAVTGVDLALGTALDLMELPAELALGSSAWVIDVQDQTPRRVLLVGADGGALGEAGRGGGGPGATGRGGEPDFGPVLSELRAGREGARRGEFGGEPSLWAYGRIGPDIGLVMIVPEHRVDSLIGGIRQELGSLARQSSRRLFTVVGLVVLLCFAGAYAMGRTVSRPIRRLADAAEAIRSGDLGARVKIRPRGDEIGKLARTFNEMVPALADRMRLRESVELANELQQGLLPRRAPEIPGHDLFGVAIYCDETGGDYFDYLIPITVGEGRFGLVVGDVTGHGLPSALIMTSVRALLQSHARAERSPGAVLEKINEQIARDDSHNRFVTLVAVLLDTRTGCMSVANAGHDPGLIFRAGAGVFDELPLGGLPLGVEPGQTYETAEAGPLSPGDVLVVGTDGIWEMRGPGGEMYGKQRLRECIRREAGRDAAGIGAALLADLDAFRQSVPRRDDVTFIVLKASGEPAGGDPGDGA